MNRQVTLVAIAAFALPFGTSAEEVPKGQMMEAVVSVTKVDPATRQAYVRGPKTETVVTLPPSVDPTDILPGTRYKVRYQQPVAVAIRSGGQASSGATAEVRKPSNWTQQGEISKMAEASGVVESFDTLGGGHIVLRTPEGAQQTFALAPTATADGPVSIGDPVTIAYVQGATTEITRSPQPERDPAPAQ